jgi:DNA repair protein RadC
MIMESMKPLKEQFLVQEVELVYKPKFKISTRPVIQKSQDIYALLIQSWDMDHIQLKEQFKVLLFNASSRLLGIQELSTGGITGTVADPRLIFAAALKGNASVIALAHNHPSGHLKPSQADILLTRKIMEAGRFLDILVMDHLVISSEGYLSMADEGLI